MATDAPWHLGTLRARRGLALAMHPQTIEHCHGADDDDWHPRIARYSARRVRLART
jgi:hypothetical protein